MIVPALDDGVGDPKDAERDASGEFEGVCVSELSIVSDKVLVG